MTMLLIPNIFHVLDYLLLFFSCVSNVLDVCGCVCWANFVSSAIYILVIVLKFLEITLPFQRRVP